MFPSVVVLIVLLGLTGAQFPPKPEGITLLKSKFHKNVTISFKEPGICETTPGVKSYSGYVHLPPGFLDDGPDGEAQNYPINTFFWFFEARKDPTNAPLAIWLNGGPGSSSMMGLLEENGPCFVAEDSKTTYLNPWSWNSEVNMLYLDQPTQVGFSYDVPTNFSVRLDEERLVPHEKIPVDGPLPPTNLTSHLGTFGSQKQSHTANTTARAAHALWHFAQTWFSEFPHYKPIDDRISLWAESYGGHYGPAIMRFFQLQNEKIRNGSEEGEGAHYLHLDTLGIVNGLIDLVVQHESAITYPYNNTYGIQIFNESLYSELMHNWTRPNGCKDKVQACQDSMKDQESVSFSSSSNNSNHTSPCTPDAQSCALHDWLTYMSLDHGWYDIAHPKADPFPPPHMYGYLTQASVLAALGTPVNYTASSAVVAADFDNTYDVIRGGFLDAIADLLDSGVRVHLVYGDRDYAANWVGGEAASLAVPYSRAAEFAAAGYAPLLTPDGWGGMTRQLGNYSFTRVFRAGHEVPRYQPAAAYEIFVRAMFGRDVATGVMEVKDGFRTVGKKSTWGVRNDPPRVVPESRCYLLKPESCSSGVWERVREGDVTVRDWFVVDEDEREDEVEVDSLGDEGGQSDGRHEVIDEL